MRRIPPHNQMTDGRRQIQAASGHFITQALCWPGCKGGGRVDSGEAGWTEANDGRGKRIRERGRKRIEKK